MGLELDGSGFGLGKRSKRYAAIVEDGVLTSLDVDEKGIDLSTCSNILLKL
jgi:peroxiredoxin